MSKRNETAEEKIARLESALEFYADPDTYAAVAFRGDPPCGDFVRDLSWDDEYFRDVPGSRARQALGWEDPEHHEVEQLAKALADAAGEEDLWDHVRHKYINMARGAREHTEASVARSVRNSLAARLQARILELRNQKHPGNEIEQYEDAKEIMVLRDLLEDILNEE